MEETSQADPGFFAPLANPNVRLYLGGQALSLMGTWMQMTAQGWLVWQLSHSTVDLGRVGMVGTAPFLFLGPFAGAFADRLDRRQILIGTQVVAMLLACVLAGLVQAGTVQLWHVYVVAGALGIVNALDMPAQQAFVGDLAGVEQIRRVVVINNMVFQASRMLGPALAGWIIDATSLPVAFWLNGASFIPVIVSLSLVRAHQERSTATRNPFAEFLDGVRFLRTQPRLQDLMVLTLLCTMFGIANGQIMPALATEHLHGTGSTLGRLMGASGAGSLTGSLLIVPATHRIPRIGVALAIAVMWSGSWFCVLSLSPSVPLSVMSIYLASMTIPVVMSNSSALLQLLAAKDMRARLMSLWLMIGFGSQPLASLFIGYNARWFSTPYAIRFNGFIMICGALALGLFRRDLFRWVPQGSGLPKVVDIHVKTPENHGE